MHSDFIKEAGVPFLAHRLKRLSEHLVHEIAIALEKRGLAVPATAGSTLVLLAVHGPMGVMEIAGRLRLTHPLIVRLVAKLEDMGLVAVHCDDTDLRRKRVSLTGRGQQEAEELLALNGALTAVFQEVFARTGVNLLDALDQFEAEFAAIPLRDAIDRQLAKGTEPCVA